MQLLNLISKENLQPDESACKALQLHLGLVQQLKLESVIKSYGYGEAYFSGGGGAAISPKCALAMVRGH